MLCKKDLGMNIPAVCCQTKVEMSEEERKDEEKPSSNREDERKEYNLGILKQIQLIFGNLAASKLQYYVPKGFWKHFK